jgi:hypothetical protein
MRKTKRLIASIILPAMFGLFFLVAGIIEYLQFLRTWGFSEIDLVFIVVAITLFLAFVNAFAVDISKGWKSIAFTVIGLALVVAWILADIVILQKGTRLRELADALWNLAFAGCFLGWLRQSRTRIHKATQISDSEEHAS